MCFIWPMAGLRESPLGCYLDWCTQNNPLKAQGHPPQQYSRLFYSYTCCSSSERSKISHWKYEKLTPITSVLYLLLLPVKLKYHSFYGAGVACQLISLYQYMQSMEQLAASIVTVCLSISLCNYSSGKTMYNPQSFSR